MTAAQRVHRFGAIAFAALALVPGYYALTLPWRPHADFDVIGILWLMQNVPRLFAFVLALGLGGAAFYCAVRSAAD